MNWYWWSRRLGKDHARKWSPRADGTPRPRVLLESPDGAEAHATWKLLSGRGYDTMWCPGPSGRHIRTCSLIRTGHCPLVDGADVIVNALDQSDGKIGEVARHLDKSASPKPVVVVTPRTSVAEFAALLPHCEVVPGPLSSKTLQSSISRMTSPSRAQKVRCTAP
jgi:hypothetical protein